MWKKWMKLLTPFVFFSCTASDLAKALIDVMAPYLNGENRDALDVYGFNRTEWQEKILTLAAPDQIRVEFGGTKVDSSDA